MRQITTSILIAFATASLLPSSAYSQSVPKVICASKKSGALSLQVRCKKSQRKIARRSQLRGARGPAGVNGTNGTNGTNGADGSLAVWGDGSDGDLVVSSNTTLDALAQYDDIVVNPGATLTVSPGTTIRCAGTFTNNGTVEVLPFGGLGLISELSPGLNLPLHSDAPTGFAISPAANGNVGDNSGVIRGGIGGADFVGEAGLDPRVLIRTGHLAAGSGGGNLGGSGGAGGGVVRILSRGALTLSSGSVVRADGANGDPGCGGGGGGLVVLASATSITAAGTVSVQGGDGGAALSQSANGGGGGGGIVIVAAPSVSTTGTITLTGGQSGATAAAGTVSATPRTSGGGGGASCGQGAEGGSTNVDGSTSNVGAEPGDGCQYLLTTDPTAFLF